MWFVEENGKIDLVRPDSKKFNSIQEYKSYMGKIDLHGMLVDLYYINIKMKQFYLRIINHIIDMCTNDL